MDKYRRTATVPIRARFWEDGELTNVTTYTIGIEDPSGQLVTADGQTMETSETGIYTYDYTSAATAILGKYTAHAFLTKGSHVEVPEYVFEIVKEVT